MNNTFFDETGLLNIDDIILQQPSFQKIMADGIVTEEELTEQSTRVITLLKSLEKDLSPEQVEKIREKYHKLFRRDTSKNYALNRS